MSSGTPWWVAGLAVLGLLTGVLAMRGLLVPFAFMGIAWSVSQPTDPAGDLLVLLLFAAIASTYAILLARRSGVPADTGSVTVTPRNAVVGGIGLAIAAGLAGFLAQHWDNDNAYWLPMTVFLLAIPAPGAALSNGQSPESSAPPSVSALPGWSAWSSTHPRWTTPSPSVPWS